MCVHAFVSNSFFSKLNHWTFLIFCMNIGIYKRSKLIDLYFAGKFLSTRNGSKLGLSDFIQSLSHEMYFRCVLYDRMCPCMMIEYCSVKADIWENFDSLALGLNAVDCWSFQIAISLNHLLYLVCFWRILKRHA